MSPKCLFVCLFELLLYVTVNSRGHVERVSYPVHGLAYRVRLNSNQRTFFYH